MMAMAAASQGPKRRAPSIQDVAKLAGVSRTTVSFVVNQTPNTNIPAETQERVWSAVRELGWRPNAMARGLRMQQSNLIGLISDEVATSPYAGKIIQGAQDAVWAQGKMLLVINTGNNPGIETAALDLMLERQIEGLIYATMYHREVALPAAVTKLPSILLDCFVGDRSIASVVPDEFQGGYDATELLLRKGHRRIGFINEVNPHAAMFGRLEGYRQALAAYGVAFDRELIRTGTVVAPEGYRCAHELLQLPERPTALFCYNDSLAMGAYDAARELGLRIPHDLAIVGFDNQELIAGQLRPGLTTMELPHYEMGEWAVNYLLGGAHQAQGEPVQHKVPCRLVERASA